MDIKDFENNIKEYTIEKNNYRLKVLNIGAIITEYSINNKNITLKYDNYNYYLTNQMHLGAIVGRTAGRIENGKFGEYQLNKNFLNKHNLHGNSLNHRFYDVKEIVDGIELSLYDEEGVYPGNAKITVRYTLTNEGLLQEIIGESDKPTLFNLTNHTYFNLNPNNHIKDLNLRVDADEVWTLCPDSLPKELIKVENTAFDFRKTKKINENFKIDNEQFKITKFIDNPFKLNGNIELSSDDGLKLTVSTNQPYVVIYTGNYIGEEIISFENSEVFDYAGICLETQKVPNDTVLIKDYYSKTLFKLEDKI